MNATILTPALVLVAGLPLGLASAQEEARPTNASAYAAPQPREFNRTPAEESAGLVRQERMGARPLLVLAPGRYTIE